MDALFHFVVLFLLTGFVDGSCNKYIGPAGSPECVSLHDYDKHQWATCLTNEYIKTKSKGEHICNDHTAKYCWYQCMIEIYGEENGMVNDDCVCGSDAPHDVTTKRPITLPTWCYSPSGDNCIWYRSCLERRYPCKEQGNSYAIDFAEKFCNLYEQQYTKFDTNGKLWIDAVRKCLQVDLAPVLRIFIHRTCQDIKEISFESHSKCYVNPDQGKPSICDLSTEDWWHVFWTVKGAVIQAATATFKQMLDVIAACGKNIFADFRDYEMELIEMKIEQFKAFGQDVLEKISETASKTMSKGMGWTKKGVLNFGFPQKEDQSRNKRNTDNDADLDFFNIYVLIASSKENDLNDENAPEVNITGEAIKAAEAIEKGDIQIDVNQGMNFTKLSLCIDYNCIDSSLQITPAPPKPSAALSITVPAATVFICSLITLLIVPLRM